MAAAGIRSARSSSAVRNVASRIFSAGARNPAAAGSPFRSLNQKPLFSQRSFSRSPVELSSCLDTTMLPFHSATASALLTSLLSATIRTYGWPLEDH